MRRRALWALAPWLAIGPARADVPASPIGVWRTFDDEDGSETGAIEIAAGPDGLLIGRLVRILNPAHVGAICTTCRDDRKGQKLLGIELIRKLHPDGQRWTGEILDPNSGRIYRVAVRVTEDGRRLLVRGYLGVTLLGRTETWLRA